MLITTYIQLLLIDLSELYLFKITFGNPQSLWFCFNWNEKWYQKVSYFCIAPGLYFNLLLIVIYTTIKIALVTLELVWTIVVYSSPSHVLKRHYAHSSPHTHHCFHFFSLRYAPPNAPSAPPTTALSKVTWDKKQPTTPWTNQQSYSLALRICAWKRHWDQHLVLPGIPSQCSLLSKSDHDAFSGKVILLLFFLFHWSYWSDLRIKEWSRKHLVNVKQIMQ